MHRTLLMLIIWLASLCQAQADTCSVSFGGKGKLACPDTLKIVAGQPSRMVFDLSAIPADARVSRAMLYCPGPQPRTPVQLHVITALQDDKPAFDEKAPLKLEPRFKRSFDVTAAVGNWVAKPAQNLGLALVSYSGQPNAAVLWVQYEGKPPRPPATAAPAAQPAQVEGLKIHHASGQTFLVWKEHPGFRPAQDSIQWVHKMVGATKNETDAEPGPGIKGFPRHPGITLKTLRDMQGLSIRDKPVSQWARDMIPIKKLRDVPAVSYRIYRSAAKITAANLKDAELVGEAAAFNAYQDGFIQINSHGEYYAPFEEETSLIPTWSVGEGRNVLPGEAYYVHTPGKAGKAFYAVAMVTDGVENVAGFASNASEAIDETADRPQPVPQWVTVNRTRYGNADAVEYWFALWLAPPLANVPDNTPRRIVYAVPEKYVEPGPMVLNTHAGMGPGWKVDTITSCYLHIEQDMAWAGDLCYHQGRGTLLSFAEGKVDYFSDRYITGTIEWALSKWKIDRTRITSSLGMHYALRHPDLLPYLWCGPYEVDYDQKWNPAFGSLAGRLGPMETLTVDGHKAWDCFDASWYLRNNIGKDIPFIVHDVNGQEGGHMVEYGWQDDGKGLAALREARQPHVAHWGGGISREIRDGLSKMSWTKSVPAFSNCSLDGNPGNGDPAEGDPWGRINGYLFWVYDDIVDEPDRWEMTVYVTSDCFTDACTVDLTPRHCKQFKPKAGEVFNWTNTSVADEKQVAAGQVKADQWNLVTLKKLTVTKGKNRIVIKK